MTGSAPSLRLDRDWLHEYPPALLQELARLCQERRLQLHVAGGAVRDWLLHRRSRDLDLVTAADAFPCARLLASRLGGAFVPLDEEEGVARVVWQGLVVDFSSYRQGSATIEEDLRKRDFTINAMAVRFDPHRPGLEESRRLIDPTGGRDDLAAGVVRMVTPDGFDADPLRLLRAFRFAAVLGFVLDRQTEQAIAARTTLLARVAPERLRYEFERLLAAASSAPVVARMAKLGLLWQLLPELAAGRGVPQPPSHHLDVFAHNLETLAQLERILQEPGRFFPGQGRSLAGYVADRQKLVCLKWAALCHDLGKPEAARLRDGRLTFYNHDRLGAERFRRIARRLRLSREAGERISRLIGLHMWPFHLNNARRTTVLTPRAYLRLIKAAREDLPGLFLLAMADSLAGQGPGKPPDTEQGLAELYAEVRRVYQQRIKPVLEAPRLLTGHDLQKELGLAPGPVYRQILAGLEQARVAGEVASRQEALAWVRNFLAGTGDVARPPAAGGKEIDGPVGSEVS